MTETAIPNFTFDETARLMAEGAHWLPGGASSDYRLGSAALVLDRGEGALLFDVDGNRLIDYYCGAGPIILGHGAPAVTEAVTRQLARGVQLGGESVDEYTAARLVTEIVPSAEMVRFANTGSEAVQLAFRIARGATGQRHDRQVRGPLPRLAGQRVRGPARAGPTSRRAATSVCAPRRPARTRPPSSTPRCCPGTTSTRSRRGWPRVAWRRS